MNLDLEGRVALVTGGAAGIGAAIATALAREGCDVATVDCRAVAAGDVRPAEAPGRRRRAYQADVRDYAEASRVVAEVIRDLGRLDILICNAGVTADASLWRMSEEQWDRVVDVNLKGCFNYMRAVAAHFKSNGGGKIVGLASINGLRGKAGQANYAASKAGIVALGKTAARELGRFNVNVNVVAPGMVMTDMTRSLAAEHVEKAAAESVLGRIATPEECADVVTFLCSERSRHITGEVIQVDGGQYI